MDMNWLASEAKQLHSLFASLFDSLVVLMIGLGVVLSFFARVSGVKVARSRAQRSNVGLT